MLCQLCRAQCVNTCARSSVHVCACELVHAYMLIPMAKTVPGHRAPPPYWGCWNTGRKQKEKGKTLDKKGMSNAWRNSSLLARGYSHLCPHAHACVSYLSAPICLHPCCLICLGLPGLIEGQSGNEMGAVHLPCVSSLTLHPAHPLAPDFHGGCSCLGVSALPVPRITCSRGWGKPHTCLGDVFAQTLQPRLSLL